MKIESKYRLKKTTVNSFGVLGYLTGFLLWLWAVILYLSLIQSTTTYLSTQGNTQTLAPVESSFSISGPFGLVIVGITVVIMVGLTVYALYAIPKTIVKTSNKLVRKTAEAAVPIVIKTQHKKITKRSRLQLTARLILAGKLLFILLPIIIALASKLLEVQFIDYQIALTVSFGLACVTAIFFSLQYILATILLVKSTDLI